MTNNKVNEKTFCFIQLTRLGDILQTLQAAAELRVEFPGVRLLLIARKQFGSPLLFVLKKIFDQVFLIDTKDIFENSSNLHQAQERLHAFINEVNVNQIDVSINLSFCKPASYFNTLIEAQYKFGPGRNIFDQEIMNDRWSQFVYANVLGSNLCPFNLVDLFKNIIGTKQNSYVGILPRNLDKKKIVIHPFASLDKKQWTLSKWAELIYQLLKDNPEIKIKVAGSTDDLQKSEKLTNYPSLKRFSHRIDFIIGKTSIEQLFDELEDTRLFIGHDSMCSHLASLQGVQTLTVSLGCVRPYETTPYGNFNYNIIPRSSCFPCQLQYKCDHFICHNDIPVNSIATITKGLLKNHDLDFKLLTSNLSPLQLDGSSIYKSTIDKTLGLRLEDLGQNDLSIDELFRKFYSMTWNFLFREQDENLATPRIGDKTAQKISGLQEGLNKLFELGQFGITYSKYIHEECNNADSDIKNIQLYSQKLGEIDQMFLTLKPLFPQLAPIIDYYHVAKSNLAGDNILELAESSFLTYHECVNAVSILHELSNNTLQQNGKAIKTKELGGVSQ